MPGQLGGHPEGMAHPPAWHHTADVALLVVGAPVQVLLIERGKPPFVGKWALPGGHVDPGETGRAAAVRELREETGVLLDPMELSLVTILDAPGRDPRGNYLSQLFVAVLGQVPEFAAADDAASARLWRVDELNDDLFAFDHAEALRLALAQRRV